MAQNNHPVVITSDYEINAMKIISNARKSLADNIRKNFSKGDDYCLFSFKESIERENPHDNERNILIEYIINEYKVWPVSYSFDGFNKNYLNALKLYQKSIKYFKNKDCIHIKNIVYNDIEQLKTFLLKHIAPEEFGYNHSYRTLEEKMVDICCILESPSKGTSMRIYGLNETEEVKREIAADFISILNHLKLAKKVYDLSSQLNEDKINSQANNYKKTTFTNKELAEKIMNNFLKAEYLSKEGYESINELVKIFSIINRNFVCIKEHLPYLKVFPDVLKITL